MKNVDLFGLFPKPVMKSELDRPFTEVELAFFAKQSNNVKRNSGNNASKDTYVLRNPEMLNLVKELNKNIAEYVAKVIVPVEGVTPYITQSWLNYTKPGEYHHKHHHENSLISGVLYIQAEDKKDKIHFFDDTKHTITVKAKEFNVFNSPSWWVGVKTGNLILFPSYIDHMVETTESKNTRISLAFNVFMSGILGDQIGLTELKLQ